MLMGRKTKDESSQLRLIQPSTLPERNIARYLPRMARERPNQVAVVTSAGRDAHGQVIYDQLTFAELDRESDRYAWGIAGYGIERGARVLLMVRAGLPLLSLTFALFKAGCVPVLIDPAMGRRNLIACIRECAPDALIGVERAHIARVLFPSAFRTLRHSVTVGRRLFWDGLTLDELRVEGQAPFPLAAMRDDQPAAIIFTTGSTGVPKGVAYEHGMLNAQVDVIKAIYGITPGEIEMPAFPLLALFNVAMGATSAIPDLDPTRPAACDPAKIVEIMNDQGVTSTFGSPAIWNKVTRYCLDHGIHLPQLRRVLMAGAPVPAAIHQRFQQILEAPADTHTPYGATEALPITTIAGREALAVQAARADPTAGTCVGRPVPGITLRVIPITDEPITSWDDQLPLPPHHVGEIVVKGALVTTTYINRPAATRLAKIPEGDATWHRMGDLGYLDDEGRLWFYGRKSQRVQLADTCLYTEPCELVFNQHPAVYRSALVGVRSRDRTTQPVIVIEPEAGQQPRSAAARARFIGELLALGARAPMTAPIATVLFHPAFPVDVRHNAKIFREQLAIWAQAQLNKRILLTRSHKLRRARM
jgi:acyl-CoA synthetase (AMP-forming)/AMP-acid ligase II